MRNPLTARQADAIGRALAHEAFSTDGDGAVVRAFVTALLRRQA
jgi:hypothetical protein